jgi:hypothetical protein
MSNPIHRSLTTDHYLYLLKERDPFSPVAAQPIQVAFKDSYKKKLLSFTGTIFAQKHTGV